MTPINEKELKIAIDCLKKIRDNLKEDLDKGITIKSNCNKVEEYQLLEKLLRMDRYGK